MADAVSVAPHNYRTVFENERVRLLEYRGKPGDKTGMHDHPDLVACAVTETVVKFTLASGQRFDAKLKAGEAMFNEAHSHSTEITGSGSAHVILVELK